MLSSNRLLAVHQGGKRRRKEAPQRLRKSESWTGLKVRIPGRGATPDGGGEGRGVGWTDRPRRKCPRNGHAERAGSDADIGHVEERE